MVAERDTRIVERDSRIAERDTRIADLACKVRQKESEVAHLIDETNRAKAEAEQIRQSTSWKVTAPLRASVRAVRSGPGSLGRFWWINPLAWLITPLWLAVFILRLPKRVGIHLRRRTHRLTSSPAIGIRMLEDGWFAIDGPAGVL